jgi:hypothetical protein
MKKFSTIPFLSHMGDWHPTSFFSDKVFATRIGERKIKCIFFVTRWKSDIILPTFSINIVPNVPSTISDI